MAGDNLYFLYKEYQKNHFKPDHYLDFFHYSKTTYEIAELTSKRFTLEQWEEMIKKDLQENFELNGKSLETVWQECLQYNKLKMEESLNNFLSVNPEFAGRLNGI